MVAEHFNEYTNQEGPVQKVDGLPSFHHTSDARHKSRLSWGGGPCGVGAAISSATRYCDCGLLV
jgi:hypothetical protein